MGPDMVILGASALVLTRELGLFAPLVNQLPYSAEAPWNGAPRNGVPGNGGAPRNDDGSSRGSPGAGSQ